MTAEPSRSEDPAHALGPRAGVKAVIFREGHVLMNHSVVDGKDVYDLPGGGQEFGETQRDALARECREEIGAAVRVYDVACIFEFRTTRDALTAAPIDLFHQVNVCYWCGLESGEEPAATAAQDMDPYQVGTSWLPIDTLHTVDVRPRGLAEWLQSDPAIRPVGLGELTP